MSVAPADPFALRLAEPAWLALALLIPAAIALGRRHGPPARRFGAGPLLARGAPATARTRLRHAAPLLQVLGLLLVVVALARPAQRRTVVEVAEGVDVLLCLDRSSSMAARDLDPERSRLQVARDAATAFVQGRAHDRVGLLAFARYPDVRCPLTLDRGAVVRLLGEVEMVPPDDAEDATGIGAALARAAQVLERTDGRSRVVVLLTDGEETVAAGGAGGITPAEAAAACAELGVRVYAIAVGVGGRDRDGALVPLDHGPLRRVAARTGGAFFEARDAGALERVYQHVDALETAAFERTETRNADLFVPVLSLAVALLAVARLLGATVLRVRAGSDEAYARGRRGALAAGGFLLAVLLLVRPAPPAGDEDREPARDVLFLLDVSRSMLARDVAPSRLEHARAEIAALAADASGLRLGLVAFAGVPRLLVPLTEDHRSFAGLLRLAGPASVPRGGTDLGRALTAARTALRDANSPDGVVVLVSDGEDLEGRGREVAARFGDGGPVVHCVGVGTRLGGKIPLETEQGTRFVRDARGEEVVTALDPDGLRAIARAAGGGFYDAGRDPGAWPALLRERLRPSAAGRPDDERSAGGRHWLLLAAFLLWLGERSVARRPRR